MLRELDDQTLVSGQITPDDVPMLRGHGVTLIVNNRPDGEEPGQPHSAEIKEAAQHEGIEFRYNPIYRGIGPADVEAMREALRECGDGRMLAFCRSGTRSTLAWAVARREDGVSREELQRSAAKAGVDLTLVEHLL
jgi:uncharacterized protein (TIGR01244 family)